MSPESLEVIQDLKSRWAKKGFIKIDPDKAGGVAYPHAGDAMSALQNSFTSLQISQATTCPGWHQSFMDNIAAYLARVFPTSSHVLFFALQGESGKDLNSLATVMNALGFQQTTTCDRDDERYNYMWSWKIDRLGAPPLTVDLRVFHDPCYGETDQNITIRTLETFLSVKRSQRATPNLFQTALVSCPNEHSKDFGRLIQASIELNRNRCINKGFRPEVDASKDKKKTRENINFYQFFDLNENLLLD